jgi:hypothetical protein
MAAISPLSKDQLSKNVYRSTDAPIKRRLILRQAQDDGNGGLHRV